MRLNSWRKHHKWLGIGFCFFMLMFCASGIILNHRTVFADVNIGRKWLPSRYEFRDWNGGLLRGTLKVGDRVVLYGNGGLFASDSTGRAFEDFNEGLPTGADFRQMRGAVSTPDGMFAVSGMGLYRRNGQKPWTGVALPTEDGERLTDVAMRGDTLIVLSRDHAYTSRPPYANFRRTEIKAPTDYDGKVTAFRTVWLLHSGELLGTAGRIIVDGIAIVIAILCITGILFWLLPKAVRRGAKRLKAGIKWSLTVHDKVGRYTIVLTLLLCITGWCLRPPVMLPLVKNRVPAAPGTTLDSDNPWKDKLRMVRYDSEVGDFLLSTSEGLFSLKDIDSTPVRVEGAPPVSVMGMNVFQKDDSGLWLCGSFSGLYVWDRESGIARDYFTHELAPERQGMPFGKRAISGFAADFKCGPFAVEYYDGTHAIGQPDELRQLPMSLWNVALEVHSGRLYMGTVATFVFVFIAGLLAVWCLWSGYKIRRKS